MSSHRKPASRKRRSGRVRAMLSLGAVGFLALGFGAQGTFAFWTDTATVNTGSFSSGTLDITVDDMLAGPGTTNNPGDYIPDSLKLPNMVPGESIAYSFPVENNGTTPLTYTLMATGAGPLAVQNGMQYSVTYGATHSNTGTPAANDRKGACGPTSTTDGNTTLLGATAVDFTKAEAAATSRALAVGASEQVCIVAHFNTQAGNELQDKAGTTASFVFSAKQVGAPAS